MNTFTNSLKQHFTRMTNDPTYAEAARKKDQHRKQRKANEIRQYHDWYGLLTAEEQKCILFSDAWMQDHFPQTKKTINDYLSKYEHGSREYANFESSWNERSSKTDGPKLKGSPLQTQKVSAVKAEEVEWFWPGLIPYKFFTLCDGIEGIGKTFFLLKLAADASRRGQNVLWLSQEDSPSVILKPRLEKLGANQDKIYLLEDPLTLDQRGFEDLEATIADLSVSFVTIDPLFSYTGRADINNQGDVRKITDPLNKIADRHHCAIVGVRHANKSKGNGDARAAGGHSIGWQTGCRSALFVGCDPENDDERGIAQTKLNVGKKSNAVYGYEIEDDGMFRWKDSTYLTLDIMLSPKQTDMIEPKGKILDAVRFLREVLADGPLYQTEIMAMVREEQEFGERTLKGAKKFLNVESFVEMGEAGRWKWRLPFDPKESSPS